MASRKAYAGIGYTVILRRGKIGEVPTGEGVIGAFPSDVVAWRRRVKKNGWREGVRGGWYGYGDIMRERYAGGGCRECKCGIIWGDFADGNLEMPLNFL